MRALAGQSAGELVAAKIGGSTETNHRKKYPADGLAAPGTDDGAVSGTAAGGVLTAGEAGGLTAPAGAKRVDSLLGAVMVGAGATPTAGFSGGGTAEAGGVATAGAGGGVETAGAGGEVK